MINTHPTFRVRVLPVVDPVGEYTHAVVACPRCGGNIGINRGMLAGVESIICKGALGAGVCNGHYYLREGVLEFVGTA